MKHTATVRYEHTVTYSRHGVVVATWNETTRELTATDGTVLVTGVSDDYQATREVHGHYGDGVSEWDLADYLVTCPHGCQLGRTARQPDRASADRRVHLHELATTPLSTPNYNPHPERDER